MSKTKKILLIAAVVVIGLFYIVAMNVLKQSPAGIAQITQATQTCGKVASNKDKDVCYLNAATDSKNIVLCDSIIGNDTTPFQSSQVLVNKDFCIQSIAMKSLDSTLCDQISLKTYTANMNPIKVSTEMCYAFVGQNTKNAALCNKAGLLKAPCLQAVNQK